MKRIFCPLIIPILTNFVKNPAFYNDRMAVRNKGTGSSQKFSDKNPPVRCLEYHFTDAGYRALAQERIRALEVGCVEGTGAFLVRYIRKSLLHGLRGG